MQSQIRRLERGSSNQPEAMISECEIASPERLWRRLARRLAFLFRKREFADHAEQRAFEAQWDRERAGVRSKIEATSKPLL
jgi:hypothetical protein